MPFQICCPFCAASLQLENPPTKSSRLTCPKCDTLFPVERQAASADDGQEIEPPPTVALEDIDVELVDSADTVIKQPPARTTPLQVSEEGVPTDPPPERPISPQISEGSRLL